MVPARSSARYLAAFAISAIALTACLAPAPQQLAAPSTTGVAATTAALTTTSPLVTPGVTPASTLAESSLQPQATSIFTAALTTRLAIVDQSNAIDTTRAGWWSLQMLSPVGQTFKPELAGLDAVELWLEAQREEGCSAGEAWLQVNIREDAIDGPLVGTSRPSMVSGCDQGDVFFDFPALVTLKIGKLYVLEILVSSASNWGVVWQQIPDSYPRGEALVLGSVGNADLWFQEGLLHPTPITAAYCQDNLWQHVKRTDGSRFTDRNDCEQYITAGR